MKFPEAIFPVMAAALIALLPMAVSCSSQQETGGLAPEITFKTNPVPQNGSTQFIAVKAASSWTVTVTYYGTDKDWININPSSGQGDNGRVMIQYSTNTGANDRKAMLTISSGSKSNNYTFTQRGTASAEDPSSDIPSSGIPVTSEAPAGWLELPSTDGGDNYAFFTHYMTVSGLDKRNYSFYWSKSDMVSIWVAYPLNSSLIGSGGRSDDNAFMMDPLLKAAGITQPDVSYTYRGYTRGHQIPSADRYSGNSNPQTFYSSNMTPQLWDFNGGIWASLEGRVRNWSRSAGTDTLYVVTGCVVDGKTKTRSNDPAGTSVSVPLAYYKAVLRHTTASTVGISGYNALAIYLPHKEYGETAVTTRDMFISVDALEKLTGLDLFANLPAKVGQEAADKIEAEDPKTVSLWNL